MESHAQQAVVSFGLNLTSFGTSVSGQEKFQLYLGLKNLAEAVASIDVSVKRIEHRLDQVAMLLGQAKG